MFTAIAESADALPFDELTPLIFSTYDGSGQVVHPDYATTPADAFDLPRHLAITPYPFGNAAFENPSFFESRRRDTWQRPAGGPDPVVLPAAGYLSDPDLVYVADRGELWLYYRQVTSDNIVQLVRTSDGRTWSAAMEVVRAPNHQIVSPSVVRRESGDWWMFAVNSVVCASELGLDILLGGFVAGMIVRASLRGRELVQFESKLTAVGFGFLIPFFFVESGLTFDLDALGSASALLKVALFFALFLVVRGAPAMLLYRGVLDLRERSTLAIFCATELPLVVAITTLATESGKMTSSTAAGLVGAAIVSTLVYPFIGLAMRRRGSEPAGPSLEPTGLSE